MDHPSSGLILSQETRYNKMAANATANTKIRIMECCHGPRVRHRQQHATNEKHSIVMDANVCPGMKRHKNRVARIRSGGKIAAGLLMSSSFGFEKEPVTLNGIKMHVSSMSNMEV